MRVTKVQIAARVARIVRQTCKQLRLTSQSNMPGTVYRLETADESRNISGLMSPKEMNAYLEGYEKALEELRYDAQDEIIKRGGGDGLGEGCDCACEVIGALFCPCPSCNEIREERRHTNDRLEKERVARLRAPKPAFVDKPTQPHAFMPSRVVGECAGCIYPEGHDIHKQ